MLDISLSGAAFRFHAASTLLRHSAFASERLFLPPQPTFALITDHLSRALSGKQRAIPDLRRWI
jgi:hypothetical protein